MLTLQRQKGLSLLEILVGMALGVAALIALASLVGYGIGLNSNLLSSARLNEESSNVLSLMQRDIRRAGYSGATVATLTDPAANPSPFANSLTTAAFPGETADSCITFTYDANDDGALNTGAGGENYGFRLRDGQIEMRQGDLTCIDAGWLSLTDADRVSVTSLTFTLSQSVVNNVPTTSISIAFEAALEDDAATSRRYNTEILVRNYDG